jgi:putative PIN family toxin of toxin-antitoxin system
MNVLIDTNILISAALRDREPEQVIKYVATQESWRWIVTADILREYLEVLRRPKFGFSDEKLNAWTQLLEQATTNIGNPPAVEFERDPKDAPFLAAVLATQLDLLITGDADLLSLRDRLPARVLTVADFVAEFIPS